MRNRIARWTAVATAGVLMWAPVSAGSVVAADPLSASMQITWTRPGVAGILAPPSAMRVGDEVTIQYTMSGFTRAGCVTHMHHLQAFVAMSVSQDETELDGTGYCRPWTFILPRNGPGQLEIDGFVHGDDSDSGDASLQTPIVTINLQAGGTPRPYASTYPVPSWYHPDILGTSSPSMNVPLVFSPPPGATRLCTYAIGGDSESVGGRPLDRNTCPAWQVTLPDPRSDADVESPFGRPWTASVQVGGGAIDPLTGAAISGGSSTPSFELAGNGGDDLVSNLPTGIAPESTHPRFALTGSKISIDPDFLNIDADGECELSYHGPITPDDGIQWRVLFEDGRCEAGSFVATEPGAYSMGAAVFIDGDPTASAGFGVEVIDPMPPPTLDVDTAVTGDPFDVAASVSTGRPFEYEIELAPTGGAGASVASIADASGATEATTATTCAAGSLDFHSEDRGATGECRSLTAGSHQVTVRFEDVTGATRTRTRTITVLAFRDIVGHKFALDITWLAGEGITSGCGVAVFCPDGLVTRGQMATFLSRALDLPATTRNYFTDDDGNKHEAAINRLRAAGITAGCGGTRFCPSGIVTRSQMATFLVRAFGLPTTTRDYFTDDEQNTHETSINRLRAAGITSGCAPTRFCPNGAVTRGQMAAFLHRASD